MEEWDLSEEETDQWLEEWKAVDRAAADYLAERVPGLSDAVEPADDRWLEALVETFSPVDETGGEPELIASVMALQHVDWLGLALGSQRRGPGTELDAEWVLEDLDGLDDVEGELEDPEGTRQVLEMALLTLTPAWTELGVLDHDGQLTERGVWGLPRALHRSWTR